MKIPSLKDIPMPEIVDAGDYELRIVRGKEIKSKSTGRQAIMVICEVMGEENAEEVIHSVWLPMAGDKPKTAQLMAQGLTSFFGGIGVALPDDEEFDLSELEGIEFAAKLGVEPNYKDKTKMENVIKQIL